MILQPNSFNPFELKITCTDLDSLIVSMRNRWAEIAVRSSGTGYQVLFRYRIADTICKIS